jgi:ATP-dependent helicase HrpB
MRAFDSFLPIDEALPALCDTLSRDTKAVLVAPPGAGKTTRVPLALMDEAWVGSNKILVLEPRRLAARGAAGRMAATLGEAVGQRVGLRVRMGSKVSAETRIEVITEGILTRMILDDPELTGVAAVLFDEFHERSLDGDAGLAFTLDAQQALRPDLRILVMSATLDGARVASVLGDAAVIESEGRSFPVETRYIGRDAQRRIEDDVTDVILKAVRSDPGSLLVFLPGQGEIKRVEERLKDRMSDPLIDLAPLYGAMDQKAQDIAVQPAQQGRRKIVLATSIAETSLTIEGVRIVIDSGLARVPRYEPGIGLTRLETVRVSRASADQRRGRAGRVEPGICYRLWEEAATGALEPFGKPEILASDLSGLMLDCAQWGVADPTRLPFIDPPPRAALDEARAELLALDAIDAQGRLTDMGRAIRALPLQPRLTRMIVAAGKHAQAELAAMIAALISERGLGGQDVNLVHRLDTFRRDRSARAEEMRRLAKGWASNATSQTDRANDLSPGALLALAYPDRIAKARGALGNFVMVNGRAANVEPHDSLAREPYLAVAEVTGSAASSRILLASPLTLAEIETEYAEHIVTEDRLTFDKGSGQLRHRRVKALGTLLLGEQSLPVPVTESAALALAEGLASLGIARWPLSSALKQWRDRVMFLRRTDPAWPDLSDEALVASATQWLGPHLLGKTGLVDVDSDLMARALMGCLDWPMSKRLDEDAPTHFLAPTGNRHPIDYAAEEGPVLTIRVQELFGLKEHPSIARGKVPLVLHLTSPAHRPIQITKDLPGFWRGSWAAVKSEMKGRYPKHPWPDDPASAVPTARAKPRGT